MLDASTRTQNRHRNHISSPESVPVLNRRFIPYIMSDTIDFDKLKNPNLGENEVKALHILSESFTSQHDPAAATAELVRSLREHCSQNESFQTADNFLFYFRMTLLNAQRIIPIEHPWHEALITAVDDLRRAGGPLVDNQVS